MPVLSVDGVRLHYALIGTGTPVTLLHGFTLSGRNWQEVIGMMPGAVTWIVPDLRGHGQTRVRHGAPCTMDACTADLEMLWDHLGLARTHVAGYSMGGRLALHVAAKRPDRLLSLVTIGAHAGLEGAAREDRMKADEALAQRLEQEGLDAFVDYWSKLPMFAGLARRGPAFNALLSKERRRNRASSLAASLRGMGAGAMESVWDQLATLTVPATFVAGGLDHPYVQHARRLGATVSNGKVEVVPGAGHPVHQERPDAFARVLAAHLAAARESEPSSSSATSA